MSLPLSGIKTWFDKHCEKKQNRNVLKQGTSLPFQYHNCLFPIVFDVNIRNTCTYPKAVREKYSITPC